jgi:SnoaL-like protein
MNRAVLLVIAAIVGGCAAPVTTGTTVPSTVTSVTAPSSSATPSPSAPPAPSAVAASPGSSPSAETAVAGAYLAALVAGDLQAAAALIAPGAKARTTTSAPYQTLEDAAAALEFVTAMPPCALEVRHMSQTGSVVVVDAEIGAGSSSACPVAPGTGIAIPLTIVNGVITVIG